MLTTKKETSQTWPTIATSASAKTIATIASRTGISPATTAPKTSSSTISAAGSPKKSSPSFRSLFESVRKSSSAVNSPVIVTSSGPLSACSTTSITSLIPSSASRPIPIVIAAASLSGESRPGSWSSKYERTCAVRPVASSAATSRWISSFACRSFVTSLPGARTSTTSLTLSPDGGRCRKIAS